MALSLLKTLAYQPTSGEECYANERTQEARFTAVTSHRSERLSMYLATQLAATWRLCSLIFFNVRLNESCMRMHFRSRKNVHRVRPVVVHCLGPEKLQPSAAIDVIIDAISCDKPTEASAMLIAPPKFSL
jgi:hypothetical protein